MLKKLAPILVCFLIISPLVCADGGLVYYEPNDPDMFYWRLHSIDRQFCAINHENGLENMLLSLELGDLKGERGAWIFPVPSEPEFVKIDLIKGFPEFYGSGLKENARDKIGDTFLLMTGSQVYTLPLFLLKFAAFGVGYAGTLGVSESLGVTVYEHIEEMGVTTELVSAEKGEFLVDYMKSKDLNLPYGFKSILDEYIGEDYSFVISWISDMEEFKQNTASEYNSYDYWIYGMKESGAKYSLGVFISFPTEKAYFPLKLTGAYGEEKIPMIIYMVGYVTPEIYPEIEKDTTTDFFIENYYEVPEGLSGFFNGRTEIKDLKYTKIKIDTPSNNLKQDLWIENKVPFAANFANFVVENILILGLLFFIICSCAASVLSGIIIYKNYNPSVKKFALFGLSNFATLIGFSLFAYFLRIDLRFTQKTDSKKFDFKETKDLIKKIMIILAAVFAIPFALSLPFLFTGEFVFLILIIICFLFLSGILLTLILIVGMVETNPEMVKFLVFFSIIFLILIGVSQGILNFFLA